MAPKATGWQLWRGGWRPPICRRRPGVSSSGASLAIKRAGATGVPQTYAKRRSLSNQESCLEHAESQAGKVGGEPGRGHGEAGLMEAAQKVAGCRRGGQGLAEWHGKAAAQRAGLEEEVQGVRQGKPLPLLLLLLRDAANVLLLLLLQRQGQAG